MKRCEFYARSVLFLFFCFLLLFSFALLCFCLFYCLCTLLHGATTCLTAILLHPKRTPIYAISTAPLQTSHGRGDGYGVIEPDKAADAGHGFVLLANATVGTPSLSATFQRAAVAVADTLAKMVRAPPLCNDTHSPWPFRVNAETNEVIEEYVQHPLSATIITSPSLAV
jgi:hypothetical protein